MGKFSDEKDQIDEATMASDDQKPKAGPREQWRDMYEKMDGPIEKFQYLCGLKELSWHDCQDAWFESQKLMPEIAKVCEALKLENERLQSTANGYAHMGLAAAQDLADSNEKYDSLLAQAKAMRSAIDTINGQRGKDCIAAGCTCVFDTAHIAASKFDSFMKERGE